MPDRWYEIRNCAEVASPALLLYVERVMENIRRMIRIAGGSSRLRPHAKTCKIPEVIRLQMAQGITKFKCATIAEAEMLAKCDAADVLLAYQPVGPQIDRFVQLIKSFPATRFSTIADCALIIDALSSAAAAAGVQIHLLLDLDCGMHRCGVEPGPAALDLYRRIAVSSGLHAAGLHVYDGHLHDPEVENRRNRCEAAFAPVKVFHRQLEAAGHPVPMIVAGGTPTFPFHAANPDVECSPGTCVFWDASYSNKLPDLDFLPAALLLARVISKPDRNRLCLDLGHKAVASEMPHPRVVWLNLPDAQAVMHSEEHLVLESNQADAFQVGDCLYGVPWHVCPTVALHSEAIVVRAGTATASWRVVARNRRIKI